MNQRLPSAEMTGAGAALLVAVAAGTSCILPTYTGTGATSASASSGAGAGGETSSSGSGAGGAASGSGSGAGGSGGGMPSATVIWQQKSSTTGMGGQAKGVAVTPKGEVLVTGAGAQFAFEGRCMVQQPERLAYVAHLRGDDGVCLRMQPYGVSSTEGRTIAAGHDEAVYFGGSFSSSLTVGNTVTTLNSSSSSPFVAREGSWVVGSTSVNTSSTVLRTNAVAVNSKMSSDLLATGQVMNQVSFGGKLVGMAGSDLAFVAQLEPATGMASWVFAYGGDATSSTHGNGITIDDSGSVFVVGDFSGSITVGGMPLVSDPMNADVFVARLDTSGNVQWAKKFGGPGDQVAVADVSVGGEVFMTGTWKGAITIGGTTLDQEQGGPGCFVACLDQGGLPRWAVGFATASPTDTITPTGIAADGSGNLFITGSFTGTADFGGTKLTETGKQGDVFLVKLDNDGHVLWSRRYGDTFAQSGGGVAVGPDGNVVLAGRFSGVLDFGGDVALNGGPTEQAFVVKLSP